MYLLIVAHGKYFNRIGELIKFDGCSPNLGHSFWYREIEYTITDICHFPMTTLVKEYAEIICKNNLNGFTRIILTKKK